MSSGGQVKTAKVIKSISSSLPTPIQNADMRRLEGQDDLCFLVNIPIQADDTRHTCDVEHYESKQGNKSGFRDWFTLLVRQQDRGLGQILFGP